MRKNGCSADKLLDYLYGILPEIGYSGHASRSGLFQPIGLAKPSKKSDHLFELLIGSSILQEMEGEITGRSRADKHYCLGNTGRQLLGLYFKEDYDGMKKVLEEKISHMHE